MNKTFIFTRQVLHWLYTPAGEKVVFKMSNSHPGFRIFIIGAGFSKLAGLPLASELFRKVVDAIEIRYGNDTKFHADLEDYIEYRSACDRQNFDKNNIDMEEFMSYLDIEHFLELRGSKAWSEEGNESQIMVRKAIGKVIHSYTPQSDSLPTAYYKLAKKLSLNDFVITLKYDVVLERTLEHIGKPYRLFPQRFKQIGRSMNIVDSEVKEVTILKLHGSVDWFDNRHFLKMKEYMAEQGNEKYARHSIFADPQRYNASPIVDGLRAKDDPLLHIHRIKDVDAYYKFDTDFNAPFILSPSHVKFVYAEPLLSFWNGLGRAGAYNLGVSIIGFSLPKHDEYIRIALYQMISNYQRSWWDEPMLDSLKDYVRFVDYQNSEKAISDYKSRYAFAKEDRSDYHFNGFSEEAVRFIFDQVRQA